MEVIEFAPHGKTRTKHLDWEKGLNLVPLGDLHVGADGFNLDRLSAVIDQTLKADCYYIGMGDYIDFMSSSNRERQINAGLFESARTIIDDAATRLVDDVIAVLKPTKGRWLGLLEGNHHWVFDDGVSSDQYIARALDAPFLGTCGMVRVRFAEGSHRASCNIWAHHGSGGGATPAAILNKLHKALEAFEADVYLMGHLHRLVSEKPSRLYCCMGKSMKVLEKTKILAGTGSFMAGYQQGSRFAGRPKGSYVERRILPPTALGAPVIHIRLIRQGRDRDSFLDMRITT